MTTSSTPHQGDPAHASPAVLTRATLAVFLARSLPALDRDIASGLLPAPCFRLRRSPRWRRDVVEAWMASGGLPRDEWEAMQRHGDGKRR